MTPAELIDFVTAHPVLWAGLAITLIALAANEWLLANGGSGSGRPVNPSEAVRLMNTDDAVVVDTRSASDYKKNHILNAIHVPVAGIDERAGEISKDTNQTIICYCGSGNQAAQAASKLRKQGYSNVYTLRGGINGWESDGLPLTAK
ncbi:rhodanese-like domain-containing protein [Salinisphaera sp. USBA-960]|uniref:rhodanese-like domain-containing protein n=1 Tax=Salinisphaera orenii TaxID=856731 RepID=UPI000DBE48B8|nr:rhodanese-like domain-containing protein [Salifodinibacter halophilus]NNC27002.1 rhodanese-like domain-containing protein [Salifodinibacter halophilus]